MAPAAIVSTSGAHGRSRDLQLYRHYQLYTSSLVALRLPVIAASSLSDRLRDSVKCYRVDQAYSVRVCDNEDEALEIMAQIFSRTTERLENISQALHDPQLYMAGYIYESERTRLLSRSHLTFEDETTCHRFLCIDSFGRHACQQWYSSNVFGSSVGPRRRFESERTAYCRGQLRLRLC